MAVMKLNATREFVMIFQIQGLCPACLVAPSSPNVRSRVSEGDPKINGRKFSWVARVKFHPEISGVVGPYFQLIVSTLLGPLLVGVLTTLITGFWAHLFMPF